VPADGERKSTALSLAESPQRTTMSNLYTNHCSPSRDAWRPPIGGSDPPGMTQAERADERWEDDGGSKAIRFHVQWSHRPWGFLPLPELHAPAWPSDEAGSPVDVAPGDVEPDHANAGRLSNTTTVDGRSGGAPMPVGASPYVGRVPVTCGDGGPQYDRADVPTAAEEAVLGRAFETATAPAKALL
jgi:hypothetical protein